MGCIISLVVAGVLLAAAVQLAIRTGTRITSRCAVVVVGGVVVVVGGGGGGHD